MLVFTAEPQRLPARDLAVIIPRQTSITSAWGPVPGRRTDLPGDGRVGFAQDRPPHGWSVRPLLIRFDGWRCREYA